MTKEKVEKLISQLTLQEKTDLIHGNGFFTTKGANAATVFIGLTRFCARLSFWARKTTRSTVLRVRAENVRI